MSPVRDEQATLYRPPRAPLTPLVRAGLVALPLSALAFVAAGFAPDLVEAAYSRGAYPPFATALASLTARFDASFADLSAAAVALLLVAAPVKGFRRARRLRATRGRAAAHGALFLLAALGWTWAAFLLAWGFNYQRESPAVLFGLEEAVPADARAELVRVVGRRVDAAREGVLEDHRGVVLIHDDLEWLDKKVRPLVDAVLADAGLPEVGPGRVKTPLFAGPLALWGGLSGVYSPFTGEPSVILPAAPGRLPFIVAHERAHLAGMAHEEAASFVALLALWRSREPEMRYSAWLQLWRHLRQPLDERSPGVQRDVEAIRAYYDEHVGPAARPLGRAYDAFLRGHGVEGGRASYGRVAELALRWMNRRGVPRVPGPPKELSNVAGR